MERQPHPSLPVLGGAPREAGASDPAESSFSPAVVHAGGVETPYLRAGRGPTVLVLVHRPAGDPASAPAVSESPQLGTLSRSFRVIVPLRAPPRTLRDGEMWIRDIIDGLGLDRPALLGPMALAPLLVRVAQRDPARVGACLLMPAGFPDPAPGAGPAADLLLRALLVDRPTP